MPSPEEFNSAVLAITRVEWRIVGPGIVDVKGSVGKDDDDDEDEDEDEDAEEDEDILQNVVVESTTEGLGSIWK